MRKIELYLDNDFKNIMQEWNEVEVFKVLSVDDNVDLWNRAISLDGKFYTVCGSQGNKYRVRELEQFNIEEDNTYDEEDIKCPICGYEVGDSFEISEESGEYECSGCGAILEWSREVTVSYSAEVKKAVEPLRF